MLYPALFIALTLAWGTTSNLYAEELRPKKGDAITIKLLDGTEITGTISKIESERVSIMHASGIAAVPLAKLSELDRKRFGYDPEATAREKNRSIAEKAAKEKADEEKRILEAPLGQLSVADFSKRLELEQKAEAKRRGADVETISNVAECKIDFLPAKFLQRQALERQKLRREQSTTEVPLGGAMAYTIPRITRSALDPKFFLFIITDSKGTEVFRHKPDTFDVNVNPSGSVYAKGLFEIPVSMDLPVSVEFVDDVGLKKSVFRLNPLQ